MTNNKKTYSIISLCLLTLSILGCKDQLDIGNPNSPTTDSNVTTESGLISYAEGAVYENGFENTDVYSWLGNSYFSLCYGYMALMGDMVGAQASNQLVSTMSIPDYFILDDGTKVTNPSPSISLLRSNNTRAQTGSGYNPTYYQWTGMYSMNMALNDVLNLVDGIEGEGTSGAYTFKAWCYFWKGYAYAAIGSLYYSGLIVDEANGSSSEYVLHDEVLERSNYYYNLASSVLDSISSESDYEDILGQLIPSFCQTEHGGVLTIDMWKRNINTMLARNIIANKLSPFIDGNLNASITTSSTTTMTTEDWEEILDLASDGIKDGDYVFTGQTVEQYGFFSATGGTVAALTTNPNTSATFKLGERFVQYFKSDDQRLENFNTLTTYNDDLSFGSRYSLTDGLVSTDGVYDYGSQNVGEYELYIAGSYEENAMMLAEANIRLGNIDAGLEYVDAVRAYMGAGVAAVAGTSLTQAEAMTELVAERRVALAFRGLTFYDNRRWGIIYDIENGGGSYGNTIWYGETEYTNATINYDFLDYWDVPADESVLNPSTSDVATENPNF